MDLTHAHTCQRKFVGNMASKGLEDLKLSNDEVKRLTNAFKNEEFRKLFGEYAAEISDPDNKARYEAEIQQMENERGMDIKFVHPEPGYVLKTSDGKSKAFVNICKNENIGRPSAEKKIGPGGSKGMCWNLPHSFAPPREDIDKAGVKCTVYDFVIHPDTYRMAETNARFKAMVHDTAFDGIARQFDVKLDRKNVRFPKINFKGKPVPTVIRTKQSDNIPKQKPEEHDILNKLPYPYDDLSTEEKMKKREEQRKKSDNDKRNSSLTKQQETNASKDAQQYTEPTYVITHRSEVDYQDYTNAPQLRTSTRPKELVIAINLPLLKSAKQVDLDIFEKHLQLKSESPAKYQLSLNLPYEVDENKGSAKFDKAKKQLQVTLPVTRLQQVQTSSNTTEEDMKNHISNDLSNDDTDRNMGGNSEKPLIEVLNETNTESIDTTTSATSFEEPVKDDFKQEECSNATVTSEISTGVKPNVNYVLPEYDCNQDETAISFVLHAGHVDESSVLLSFSPVRNGCHLKMSSKGSGGFSIYYSFCLSFPESCKLDIEQCKTDVSTTNVVLLLAKLPTSAELWDDYFVGTSEKNMEVCKRE